MDEEFQNSVDEEENKNNISADLIRGHINTIILRTLYERDKYGYEIIEDIESKSHGQYSLKQPTLYSALKRLESQGYINAYWKTDEVSNGGRRKYYTLTDSGREITEKNQSEWEYSRTVIDSLISDKNFDFSQPAPSPVDFKILKTSTSRVRTVKFDDEDKDDIDDAKREVKFVDDAAEKFKTVEPEPIVEDTSSYISETAYTTNSTVVNPYDNAANVQPQPAPQTMQQPMAQPVPENFEVENIGLRSREETARQNSVQSENIQGFGGQPSTAPQPADGAYFAPTNAQTQAMPASDIPLTPPVPEQPLKSAQERYEEERRMHENYLRLISEPIEQKDNSIVPDSNNIDTEKLIYNNKPEPERDYKNLVNNLFIKTVNQPPKQPEQPEAIQQIPVETNYEDASVKASKDGLTVSSSEYTVSGTRRKKYNRGFTLLKCSLIVGVILLFEFAISLAFKDSLGISGISIGYPIVILAIAVAQVAIFGILTTTDFGKCTRKPASHSSYLTASVVITIILILIIFVTSLLLNVNFSHVGDIAAKIIIPCLVVLNVPIFATIFYSFSK